MKKILILGATGLIGHQVYFRLKERIDYKVFHFSHQRRITTDTVLLDVRNEHLLEKEILKVKPDVIVNCMGVLIDEANNNLEHAIFLNTYIPHRLKSIANVLKAKLIHISTDCVFSGKKGSYKEEDVKDAEDNYGRTKALGEVTESSHVTLRTSVFGPEIKDGVQLFHWFMKQQGSIKGFTKSLWSGVSTLELAKAVEWAIESDVQGLYHITNGQLINKFDLLMLFKKYTKRDIEIEAVDGRVTNKSFIDTRKKMNYNIPNYDEMIRDMVVFMKNNPKLYAQYSI